MSKSKIKIIGIGGVALSGKDSLFKSLQRILNEKSIKIQRFALADELKIELNDFTRKNYGISSFTSITEEKNLIRDLMVAHGGIKRKISKGTHWTKILNKKIQEQLEPEHIPVITDIRFKEYEFDETDWIKSIIGGKLIYVTRILPDGSFVKPINKTEESNDPLVKINSDYKITWPTTENEQMRDDCVRLQLKGLIDSITENE